MANKIRKSIKSKKKHNNTRKLKKKTRKCKTGGGVGNNNEAGNGSAYVKNKRPAQEFYNPRARALERERLEAQKLLEAQNPLNNEVQEPLGMEAQNPPENTSYIADSIVKFDKLINIEKAVKSKESSISKKDRPHQSVDLGDINKQIDHQITYAKNTFQKLLETLAHKQILDKIESPIVLVDLTNIERTKKFKLRFSEQSIKNTARTKLKTKIANTQYPLLTKEPHFIYIYDDANSFLDEPNKLYRLNSSIKYHDLILNCTIDNPDDTQSDKKPKCFESGTEGVRFNESDDYVLILLNIYLKEQGKDVYVYSNDNYSFLREEEGVSIVSKISRSDPKSKSKSNTYRSSKSIDSKH